MSKTSDLQQMPRPALRRVTEWLDVQGRVGEDFRGWRKPDFVGYLGAKLTREEVDALLDGYEAAEPYFEGHVLASALGLPSKDAMLEASTREGMRAAMEALDEEGRVGIYWRSLGVDDLRDYLRKKCSREELASLLLGIEVEARKPRATRPTTGRSSPDPPTRSKPVRSTSNVTVQPVRTRYAVAFGKYEIIERLKPGAMGEVLKVKEIGSSELLFMKRVRLDSRDARSLKREGQIYSKLSFHDFEHVLRVHAIERDDEFMALVTDFADGGDLASHVPRDGLSPIDAKAIGRQIALGIAELHKLDVVHRDIKPQNVVQHRRVWKLADFGIAKNTTVQASTTFQSHGTPGYCAPEQTEGSAARPSADIFSLGKLLTFLLTRQTDPDSVHLPSWRVLVFRCTERVPENRPDAPGLLKEIERLIV